MFLNAWKPGYLAAICRLAGATASNGTGINPHLELDSCFNRDVLNVHEPLLVNTIGHSAGALIFGIFLFLFLKDRASSRFLRGSWLSFTAAGLAFLWDLGSLGAMLSSTRGSGYEGFWIAFSFAMLSLLPAVLLNLSLDANLRAIVMCGYVLSFVA